MSGKSPWPVDPATDLATLDGDALWKYMTSSHFSQIPNVLFRVDLGLDPMVKFVLLHLLSWIRHETPSGVLLKNGGLRQGNVAEWTALDRKSVNRSFKKLTDRGFLVLQEKQPGDANVYSLDVGLILKTAMKQYTTQEHEREAAIRAPGPQPRSRSREPKRTATAKKAALAQRRAVTRGRERREGMPFQVFTNEAQ